VPVYEICITLPFVMVSSKRKKDISCGRRPGVVEDERIWEICSGLPVSVERTSREVSDLWVVNLRNWGGGAVAILAGFGMYVV
jgi:hypothetical protein